LVKELESVHFELQTEKQRITSMEEVSTSAQYIAGIYGLL